ncbi:MAG: phosphodiester glycosidase family protein, partial [Roseimicrobium sp.]
MRRVLVLLWLALSCEAGLQAQWRIAGQSEAVALLGGATHVRREVSGPVEVELKLVFFDAAKCDLRVIDQPQRASAGSLGDAMRARNFIAGCNAGYFNPEFAPLGLVISQGARTGGFQKSSLLGGVVLMRKGRPTLLWRDEYVEQKGVTELVQAGPRLVNGGNPVAGLDATKRRARTFIATDCAGKWA